MYTKGAGCIWLIRTILFVTTLLLWSSTLSRSAVYVAAVASKSTPGEMKPNETSIRIGGSASITCSLHEPHSSEMWFIQTIKGNMASEKKNITQPSEDIQVVDNYTAVLKINNATENVAEYQCMMGSYGIGIATLYVGTEPQNVTDFECVVYNYDYMQCKFTAPKNMVPVEFNLKYKANNFNYVSSCELNDNQQCNVTNYTPQTMEYLFTLTQSNALGRNIQNFTIYTDNIVKMPPLNVNVSKVTSDRVILTWNIVKISYYNDSGLEYAMELRESNGDWKMQEADVLNHSKGKFSVAIKGLHSYWQYFFRVRVKTKKVNNKRFWSYPTIVKFITTIKRPQLAPDAPHGSFYIDSAETHVTLYWSPLAEKDHCGPDFHYVVYEITPTGVEIFRGNTTTTSIILSWKKDTVQNFTIKSANIEGHSEEGSVIRVYRSSGSRYELNEKNIAKGYHNGSYTLSWSPPIYRNLLLSYTVFWCTPQIESWNQCKGPISFKYVDKTITNFTTGRENRSLNMAVSANYMNYSTGMIWARCSREVSSKLMEAEIEANALNSSSVLIKWNSGSVCSSILKGYNLTYCLSNGTVVQNRCICSGKRHTEQFPPNFTNYTINNLPPYKYVCASIVMFSSDKNGKESYAEPVKTKASAPSPPMNVSVNHSSITSKSARIEWKTPQEFNGVLSHYTIYWRKDRHKRYEMAETDVNQTSYILTGLSSYSTYEAYVTAHTVEESKPSEIVTISTLIGIPSSPRNVKNEKDDVIYWDQPDLPSGKNLFYVVTLVSTHKGGNETKYERVSVVRGRSCRYQPPDCSSSEMTFSLKVRAVNAGERSEIDEDIKSMSPDSILNGASVDQSFCRSDEENAAGDFFDKSSSKSYFASHWIDAPRTISCFENKTSIYFFSFLVVIAFVAYICYWMRKKYYKMKNIKVILPEGLIDQVSNYKFSGNALSAGCDLETSTKKKLHPDISRSNDCLVGIDNQNLISDFHTRSTNALSSLSSTSSSKDQQVDEPIGEHPSLETTNEELSSNSSSSSHSNLTYQNNHQILKLTPNSSKDAKKFDSYDHEEYEINNEDNPKRYNELEEDAPSLNIIQSDNGYVTHNTQLLASLLNASDRTVPSFSSSFPAMTNDGYIQPSAAKQLFQPQIHHPPAVATSQNGYTTLEALSKMSEETTQNLTSPQSANSHQLDPNSTATAQTSPVIRDLEEIEHHHNKEVIPTEVTHQANTNSNTIGGYVTQQQLANFGNNVALAKELNT
ncbi:cytokine receptor-like [Haematobia irritans]|uniref:cytokine receptor-like n=1 Tax=Haematobia irritans TaxID=7368 RepID=UPI003F50AEF8